MEPLELLQALTAFAESVTIIAVLMYGWLQEKKRADRLEDDIIEDWKVIRARRDNPHD